jgi:Peptidyl-tRNA hydrolase PTH2
MTNFDNPYVLVILMRQDMESMNPGKACAQAAHAANCFGEKNSESGPWNEWAEDRNFGTTLVYSCTGQDIDNLAANIAWSDKRVMDYDIIIDPTYPVRDGEVTHHVKIITCAYIFGRKNGLREITDEMELELMK